MINDILDFLDMRQLSIILISFELYYNIISTNEMKFIMFSHNMQKENQSKILNFTVSHTKIKESFLNILFCIDLALVMLEQNQVFRP